MMDAKYSMNCLNFSLSFRVIISGLDNGNISENTLVYALYSQICHVNLGFDSMSENDAKILIEKPCRKL